jgi:hypothetical protein
MKNMFILLVAIFHWIIVKGKVVSQHKYGEDLYVTFRYKNRLYSPLAWILIILGIVIHIIMNGLRGASQDIIDIVFGTHERRVTFHGVNPKISAKGKFLMMYWLH